MTQAPATQLRPNRSMSQQPKECASGLALRNELSMFAMAPCRGLSLSIWMHCSNGKNSDDANATRAFLRDVLGWKYVAEDFDNDWLIFKSGPSELGVHLTHSEWEGKSYDYPRHHSIALMCDDIDTTVGELRAKGAQFRGPIEEREYGRIIMMIVPGADDIQLYQPTHKLAYNL
jgi:catechol 2,3-dioxygenase-like lactoylglutathione lyase family enzyme